MKSNKITLDNFIKIFDILVKDFLNLKYTNIIYVGSIYCYINNIKILAIETNLFIFISIFLSLVHFYNFTLEYQNFKDSFLRTNIFKLVLIILIVISFLVVSFELSLFLNLFISKFCVLIGSFFSKILNPYSPQGNTSPGGNRPPNSEAIIAAQGANENRGRDSFESSHSASRPEESVDEEIPDAPYYPRNEIGLEGPAERSYRDTGRPVSRDCTPIHAANKPLRLEDLSPSTD